MKTSQTKTSSSNTTQQAEKHSFFGKKDSALAEPAHFFGPRKEGNSFFNASSIQPKLTVGQPNDPYEREADAVADKVVQKMGEKTGVQKKEATPSISALLQPKCNDCEKEEGIQKKENIPEAPEKGSLKTVPENTKVEAVPPKVIQSRMVSPAPAVQAQCSDCGDEEKLQKKEEGPEGPEKLLRKAIFESNEDQPVQPKAQRGRAMRKEEPSAITDIEEEKVQKKTEDASPEKIPQKNLPEITPVKLQTKPEPATLPVKQITPAPAPVQTKCEACETEDKSKEEEGEGDLQTKIFKKPIFDTNNNAAALQPKASSVDRGPWTVDSSTRFIQRRCRECEEGSIVLRKAAHLIQREPVSGQSGSGTPEAIVEAAKGELGKVQARNDDGSGKRVGSDRLLEYFHVAAPGVWPDSIIETAGAEMPSWCGIFSIWAHKKAGKDVGNWEMGKGVSSSNSLTPTTNPQPGDIGYIDQPYQHHCIIEKVEGDTIHSIDGNSGLFSEVIRNVRPRSVYKNAFFTAFGGGGSVQRKEEAEPVQAKDEESAAPPNVEQQLNSSRGGGQSLPEATRSGMEQSMGADFSGVRIHTDSSAVQMNKDLHAQAFTHGSDIYFNSGKFDTGSSGGQHLLAHELTHVVQQGSAPAVQQKAEEETEKPAAVREAPKEEEVINTLPERTPATPQLQKQAAPTGPDGDASSAAQAVYDALDGWTSSADSAEILAKFRNRNKATCDFMITEVSRLSGLARKAVFKWMLDDMVSSDWTALRNHFITTAVSGVEQIIAAEVYNKLTGYTSQEDSRAILNLFAGGTPVMDRQMTAVLSELQLLASMEANDMARFLFNDMTAVEADRLSTHFFNSGSMEAVRYAAYWRANKVKDLISGWTGPGDSTMVVTNFERTPAAMRSYVLYDFETMCQQTWSESAAQTLMKDMWQSDYERLRELVPSLPVWNVERNWLEGLWNVVSTGFDYLEALFEYAVCGLVGVIWGVLLIVRDVVVVVWDLVQAQYNILGWILNKVSGGRLAREEAENVSNFFTAMGQFFGAPGAAISQMWNEMLLEASLIEGPFRECRQAVFWVSRITNFLVNIILIFAGGYGAAKLVAEGIEALVGLARAGELMAALSRLPGRMWGAIKGLPAAAAESIVSGIGNVARLIRSPMEIVGSVRNTLTIIRMAAAEEGYFTFLRRQAGRMVAGEREFWQQRRQFWTRSAETSGGDLAEAEGKLVQAVESSVDDPARSEALIAEAEESATATRTEVDEVLNDVNGTTPQAPPGSSFETRLPERWRSGSPDRPGMLDYAVTKLRAANVPEDTIVAIIRNAAQRLEGNASEFFYHLNRFGIRGEAQLGRAGFQTVLGGLSGDTQFPVARMLMEKISNSTQNLEAVMRIFTLEDIGGLRTRYPNGSGNEFFNDLNKVASRFNGSHEEMLAIFTEAGDGQQGWDKLMEAMDRLGEGSHTAQQVRESLDFGRRVANAVAQGGDELVRTVWGEAFQGRDPATGRIRVSAALTDSKAGDQASAYMRNRMRALANQVIGGEGGTQIDRAAFDTIREVIWNTDLPTIVKNDIVGELWSLSKATQYRNIGYTVIREVSIRILNADGTASGMESRLDAVLRRGNEMLFKEFKSSGTAGATPHQDSLHPLMDQGARNRLQPFGARAEEAFGGSGMPDFRPAHVDVERPPF